MKIVESNDLQRREKLTQFSTLVNAYQQSHQEEKAKKFPAIFISYSRRDADWLKEAIYLPLPEAFGEENVFFDTHSLKGGVGWMATLADAISNSIVFLPVYTESFFKSDFCQWELQLALSQDPVGFKNKIIPIMKGKPDLPAYCSLIQAETLIDDCRQQIIDLVRPRIVS